MGEIAPPAVAVLLTSVFTLQGATRGIKRSKRHSNWDLDRRERRGAAIDAAAPTQAIALVGISRVYGLSVNRTTVRTLDARYPAFRHIGTLLDS
jgi:hypothetical protein